MILRDISERKRSEVALNESEERFRLMVEGVRDYSIFMLDPQGYVATWNTGAELMKGYRADEIIGKYFSCFYMPEDINAGKPQHELEIAASGERYEEEGWRLRRDGSRFWANVVITALHDVTGQLRGFVKVTRDITERKQAEKDREDKLLLEARNAELDRFAYTVSHDLRSPLTTITGFLKFLQSDIAKDNKDRIQQDVKRIEAAVRTLRGRLDKVLELSRAGLAAYEPETISLDKLVAEILELMSGPLEAHGVYIIVQPDLPNVLGDKTRLGQLMQNLVENAIKYRNPQTQPEIEIGYTGMDDRGYVTLFVRDNGIGIPKENQGNIFELFNKVNANSEGSGIGLALVKRIIDVHGGRIWLESETGTGSTFFFTLPSKLKSETGL